MHNRIYSWGSVETFTGQVPQLPDQKSAEVVHFQPSHYKEQVWYAILGFSCCCLFPVACAIAHITCVLNSKYHANSPEIKVECYNNIQWHQSIFFPVCLWSCRSGLSLGSGLFPICQRSWLRHMGECSRTLMKCTCQQGKSQMWRAGMMKNCTVGMMNSSKCLTSISTKCGQTVSLISNVVHF